jgi:hypothetical protein
MSLRTGILGSTQGIAIGICTAYSAAHIHELLMNTSSIRVKIEGNQTGTRNLSIAPVVNETANLLSS